jgi:carbonic anhydrase
MTSYQQIFENNQKWVAEHSANVPDFFTQLAASQAPDYLYIGCSDSRVTAEELMGVAPGEVFVHRNIANMVVNNDLNSLSVLEYAVRHLHVKHIVVCGHYGCGGVKAAMQPKDLGILNPWLRNIRDVYRLHHTELDAIADVDARYDRLVELNVQEQCVNVLKSAVVQEQYLLHKIPVVHGWVFDLRTGLLKDLKLDYEHILHNIQQIYDLSDEVAHERNKAKEDSPAEEIAEAPIGQSVA